MPGTVSFLFAEKAVPGISVLRGNMKILIVSGFLGAGKTTFIKELIKRSGTRPVVLENEYGDNSIDARELKSAGKKLEVLEFMEGCVCCTMKDSFMNSVLTVYSGLSPEYLIVEPTGVGRLSSIISNLQPILHGDISLLKPVVVLAPRSYHQNMSQWGDLYREQIAHAGTVVFSKCENEQAEVLTEVTNAVKEINKNADIIDRHYCGQSDEWFRSVMEVESENIDAKEVSLEKDSFSQITLNDMSLEHPSQLIMLLEDCLRGQFGRVARAKGTIPVGGEVLRFDLADGLYSIADSDQTANQCVFIGEALDEENIIRRMGKERAKKIAYRPGSRL
jgi:G3E family GTPase